MILQGEVVQQNGPKQAIKYFSLKHSSSSNLILIMCFSASLRVCDTWFSSQSHAHVIVRTTSIKRICISVYVCRRTREWQSSWGLRSHLSPHSADGDEISWIWRLWPSCFSAPWQPSVWRQVGATQQCMLEKPFAYYCVISSCSASESSHIWLK